MIPGSKKDMEILEKQECGEGIVEEEENVAPPRQKKGE